MEIFVYQNLYWNNKTQERYLPIFSLEVLSKWTSWWSLAELDKILQRLWQKYQEQLQTFLIVCVVSMYMLWLLVYLMFWTCQLVPHWFTIHLLFDIYMINIMEHHREKHEISNKSQSEKRYWQVLIFSKIVLRLFESNESLAGVYLSLS